MWKLANSTRFAADRTVVRDHDGAETWLVVVKGTFLVEPDGSTRVADQQVPVVHGLEYMGKPGASSLRYESDFVLAKPTTDILLHGHAYALGGQPATRVDVTMKVGPIQKTLRVTGDRHWYEGPMGWSLTSPKAFDRMPITYERAFGGTDALADSKKPGFEQRNPVGSSFAVEAKHLRGRSGPNIEYPNDTVSSWNSRPRPAGFGPVARHWAPRVNLAGTYDDAWEQSRFPLLPADFDTRFYLCAPEDQQAPNYLRGGERVELSNLTPSGNLAFMLPRVVLYLGTEIGHQTIEQHARLHTVILEPDDRRVILVWHSALRCHGKVLKIERTRIREKEILERAS